MSTEMGEGKTYALLHTIFDDSPIGLVITNVNGTIEFVNKRFCETTGFTADDLIGNNPKILKSGWHSKEYYTQMWNTILAGQAWNHMFRNKKKNGELYWEQQYIFPLKNNSGQIIRFISIKVDVSRQKEYEEKLIAAEYYLKSIFNALPTLMFVITANGTIREIMANDEQLLYVERQAVINKNIQEIFPPEKAMLFMDFINRTCETETSQTIEYPLETLKGYRWFEARSGLMKNMDEPLIIVVATDITERKNYEKQLQSLIETKDKFFSIIAHDLKNPLHAIMALSEMLTNENYIKENVTEIAHMLHEAGQSAYGLLENLLEWSRAQTGKIIFSPSKQNLSSLVDDSITILQNHAFQKNITLYNCISDSIEWTLDRNLIVTVIRNLVSNALKFTPNGGFVKIWAETQPDQLVLCVEDNGKGIKPEILPTLFTTSNITTPGTRNEKGSGLGLLLCKELIKIHKGRIFAESIEGQGSKFFVELPAL